MLRIFTVLVSAALMVSGCVAGQASDAPVDDPEPGLGPKADEGESPAMAQALGLAPQFQQLGRCQGLELERSAAHGGLSFKLDALVYAFRGNETLTSPAPEQADMAHTVSSAKAGALSNYDVVRLDYEYQSSEYTRGVGAFAHPAYDYRYVRLELRSHPNGDAADVVYSEWSRDTGTILPYAKVFEFSCAHGVVSSR